MKENQSIANLANDVVDMTLLGRDYTTQSHAKAISIAAIQQEHGFVFNGHYIAYINRQIAAQS